MTSHKDLNAAAQDVKYIQDTLRQLSGEDQSSKPTVYTTHNFICLVVALVSIACAVIAFFTHREASLYNIKRLNDLQRQLDRLESRTQDEAREIRGKIDLHDAYIKKFLVEDK